MGQKKSLKTSVPIREYYRKVPDGNLSSIICQADFRGVVLEYDQTFILWIERKLLRQIKRKGPPDIKPDIRGSC